MTHKAGNDELNHSTIQTVILSFETLTDISNFKRECQCNDFYIDRDALTLVGTFTEDQLLLATAKYNGSWKKNDE